MNAPVKYIMMLEDDTTLHNLFKSHLKEVGAPVEPLFARSIHEAQVLLSHYEPDFFVVDINLPDGDGVDFLCDVKTVFPSAKFVVMTAAPLPGSREKAGELGAVRFLDKPFEMDTLWHIIRAELEGGGQGPKPHESFMGTLRQLQLMDVIQIKCMGGSTCVLQLSNPRNETGTVYIREGRIIHAQTLHHEGVEAFNEMIRWKGGTFSEVDPVNWPEQTITDHWQSLVLEALRLADEASENESVQTS